MKKYTLKPLEWLPSGPEQPGCCVCTVFGFMNIDPVENGYEFRWCFDEYYDEGLERFDSLEAAKQRAQEFYESRILPALNEVQDEEKWRP